MEITEIRIRLLGGEGEGDKLRAFCSVTFDEAFAVHDLKIIEGPQGFFVAMPTRRPYERCPSCSAKNPVQGRFCCECGARRSARRPGEGRSSGHIDVAHPITAAFRRHLHDRVVESYLNELALDRGRRDGDGDAAGGASGALEAEA